MKLLFEIGTEELPADYVEVGRAALASLLEERLKAARLGFETLKSFATPRRLAVRVEGLAERQERLEEERRGPPAAAAFKDGQPTPAALGFAKSAGVPVEALFVKETDRGPYVFARVVDEGRPAREVLPPLLAEVVRALPAKRKMRWGEGEGPFVRPVRWLLALLDADVLPVEIFGVHAGRATRGHRFLAPDAFKVEDPATYEEVLLDAKVIADPQKRQERIVFEVETLALSEGLEAVIPGELLAEVNGLVEWPVAVLGRFDAGYLELPDEVLATIMIHHQRFFPLRKPGARLTNAFVGVANNEGELGVIRAGYEGVLKGRLDDGVFFWRQDLKTPLAEHREKLKGMAFARGLGTMWDKAERVGLAAERLAPKTPADPAVVAAARPLLFSDLGTQMVYEFPELAGTMAKHYALKEGHPEPVAQALEDAPRPEGAAGPLPQTDAGAVFSVADKADTLLGFFHLGKRPKGSADPFGLRRAAFALVRVLGAKGFSLPLDEVFAASREAYQRDGLEVGVEPAREAAEFAWERLENLVTQNGLHVLAFRAARAASQTVRGVLVRALLLQALMFDPRFTDLFLLYKRAANLLKKAEGPLSITPERFESEEERALFEALATLRDAVAGLIAKAEAALPPFDPAGPLPKLDPARFEDEITALLEVKARLDRYLDRVLVMHEDPTLRQNRLALLAAVVEALKELGALEVIGG